ncbi:MAG: hypothetical protein ACOCXH_08455 [Cyclobacteriaceae bacterium]
MEKEQVYSIPPKDRQEWKMLVTSKIEHRFQNFVLQMKSAEYSSKIAQGNMSVDQAIDEIYSLCEKYNKAVQLDFKKIFNNW